MEGHSSAAVPVFFYVVPGGIAVGVVDIGGDIFKWILIIIIVIKIRLITFEINFS